MIANVKPTQNERKMFLAMVNSVKNDLYRKKQPASLVDCVKKIEKLRASTETKLTNYDSEKPIPFDIDLMRMLGSAERIEDLFKELYRDSIVVLPRAKAIGQWKSRGYIPAVWRRSFALIAKADHIKLPDDFMYLRPGKEPFWGGDMPPRHEFIVKYNRDRKLRMSMP